MRIDAQTFEQLVLDEPDELWELHCGSLVRKPPMTTEHELTARRLAHLLNRQLDWEEYSVAENSGRARRTEENYFLPDVAVIPMALVRALLAQPRTFEVYDAPLPLVVEIWSRSTGGYDVRTKLAEYQRRGDAEIWLLHPYRKTLTAWRRQADDTYAETVYRGGVITPVALPGVRIDLDALFAWGA